MNDGAVVTSFSDRHPEPSSILGEAIAGLTGMPKTLPSKYFYDARGSELFQRICALPEYYVTRTETALLGEIVGQAAEIIGPGASIIEYGTGSSEKIGILLSALERPTALVAVDISGSALRHAAEAMARDFPDLAVHAVCTDFTKAFKLPDLAGQGRRVVFFSGSSLGNFDHAQSVRFLAN
ncbi:MAG: L-histidine N(alpha)-methyltransferase, partial [Sphingomonas bacterium]|nr:L-histidine N(alpha)-methyltransferase [Sphingomonas bacterium]